MTKEETLKQITRHKLVAVVRLDDPAQLHPVVDALLEGGVRIIEATMTIPGLLQHVPQLVQRVGDEMIFGIGSVLSGDVARQAAEAGATFIVSPVTKKEIILAAHDAGCAVAAGAYTPTEIERAWELGSDVVKVFPSDTLGPSYIKGVIAPMPHLKLLPTGGVGVENVGDWLRAGAVALGVGSALVDSKAVRDGRYGFIREKAEAFVAAVERSAPSV